MASYITMADRWVADDGRTWMYSGSTRVHLHDMPDEVVEVVLGGCCVTDTLMEYRVSHDGTDFVVRATS